MGFEKAVFWKARGVSGRVWRGAGEVSRRERMREAARDLPEEGGPVRARMGEGAARKALTSQARRVRVARRLGRRRSFERASIEAAGLAAMVGSGRAERVTGRRKAPGGSWVMAQALGTMETEARVRLARSRARAPGAARKRRATGLGAASEWMA